MCGEIDGGTTSSSKTHRVEKSSVIRKQHSAADSTSASVGSHSAPLVTVLNGRIARFSRTMNPLMVALMLKCTTSTNMSVNPPWRTSRTSASPYANSAQSPPTKTQSARLTSFLHDDLEPRQRTCFMLSDSWPSKSNANSPPFFHRAANPPDHAVSRLKSLSVAFRTDHQTVLGDHP